MSAFLNATKGIVKKQSKIEEKSITNETATIQSRPSNNNVQHDFPFNIDEIFQADVERFGQLKDVIKYILDKLENSSKQIHMVETKMTTKLMQVDK